MRLIKVLNALIKQRFNIKTPLIVSLALTFRCNFKCKFCGIWKVKRKEMSTIEVKKLIKEFSKNGMQLLIFTGGEPLLRKDIGELVNYAKSLGVYTHTVTNGSLIKDRIKEIQNVDSLSVSLEGPKKINDEIRGKGNFKRALEGIEIAKENGIFVHIISSIWKGNVKNNFYGIHKLLELSKTIGCKINFQPIYTDQYFLSGKSFFPTKDELKKALKIIEEYKKETKNVIASDSYFNWIKNYNTGKMDCYAGKLFCYVFPDGLIAPCYFKENLCINGIKIGFMNAFNNLPKINPCKCLCHGYNEYNLCFSFNIGSILNTIQQIEGFVW